MSSRASPVFPNREDHQFREVGQNLTSNMNAPKFTVLIGKLIEPILPKRCRHGQIFEGASNLPFRCRFMHLGPGVASIMSAGGVIRVGIGGCHDLLSFEGCTTVKQCARSW